MRRRSAIFLSVLVVAAVWGDSASAQPAVPSAGDATNPMLAVCSGFLAQGAGSVSGDKAKLCSCLVRETGARLSTAEMEAYAAASLNNQSPPKEVMDKVMAIATICLREAQ